VSLTTANDHLRVARALPGLPAVVADAADGRDYIVTARDMDDDEKASFRRKGR
jgi:hypothetical protein